MYNAKSFNVKYSPCLEWRYSSGRAMRTWSSTMRSKRPIAMTGRIVQNEFQNSR